MFTDVIQVSVALFPSFSNIFYNFIFPGFPFILIFVCVVCGSLPPLLLTNPRVYVSFSSQILREANLVMTRIRSMDLNVRIQMALNKLSPEIWKFTILQPHLIFLCVESYLM